MRCLSARISVAALCVTAALGLTACDAFTGDAGPRAPFDGLTGPEVTNKAVAATRAAATVRLTVTTESADGPVQAFVASGARGACTGTFSLGSAGTLELIRADGAVYTKSDAAMLRAAAADGPARDADANVDRLAGRWVKARPDDHRTARSLRFCDPKDLLDRLAATSATTRKGRQATIAGTPCLTLTGGTGREKWTASVATEGTPHLLKMRLTDGTEKPLTVEFSEFDAPLTVTRPAAD
ncbi:hypothetical protein ABZS61_09690 [Streptomyces sp. NPDC005566]|uniref:hypothetical protein n=1 Tax=Streptomyces sp. NPDC005566 TaxID=3156886 RepID=UPI0033A855E8